MSSPPLLSPAEYLANLWRPDCDYVDGELEERNVGEFQHARMQALLIAYFYAREKAWNVKVAPELCIQVSANRFRVADFCVLSRENATEAIITAPPLLVVEVLSPEDRVSRIEERIKDYLAMGIPYVWLIDPASRRAWVYTSGQRTEAREGILHANPPIELPLAELLDEV